MVCIYPGIVIVGEDTVARYDLGIFVASIVPGGPADKDGRIRPGNESQLYNQHLLAHEYKSICVYAG